MKRNASVTALQAVPALGGSSDYALSMVNNRVDTYTNEPLTLKEIDIKLVYPDGTPVNNNGGRFTLLLEIVRLV